jgi:hypothetical protein
MWMSVLSLPGKGSGNFQKELLVLWWLILLLQILYSDGRISSPELLWNSQTFPGLGQSENPVPASLWYCRPD